MDPCSACILLAGNSCELFDCWAPRADANDEEAKRVLPGPAALTVAALLLLFEAKVSLEFAAAQPPLTPAKLLGAKTMRDQPDLCCFRNLCLMRGDGVEVVKSWVVQPPVAEDVVTALAEREVQLSLLPLGLAAYGES